MKGYQIADEILHSVLTLDDLREIAVAMKDKQVELEALVNARLRKVLEVDDKVTISGVQGSNHIINGLTAKVVDVQQARAVVRIPDSVIGVGGLKYALPLVNLTLKEKA